MLSSVSGYGSSGTASMLQKFFSKADANTDSSLSKDELIGALSKTTKASDSGKLSSAVDDLVGSLDTDSDGSLSATEFSSFSSQFDTGSAGALLAAQEASAQQRFQSVYSSLDSDGSGGISQDELGSAVSSALSSSGRSSSSASAAASDLFSSLDSDSDGSVSSDELSSALTAAESDRPPPPPGPPPGAQSTSFSADQIQSVYSSLDSDGSGGVSQDELGSAVSSYLSESGNGTTDADTLTADLFSSLDADSDGSVSQDELTSALESAQGQRPPPPMGPPPANDSGASGDSSSSSSSGTASAASASGSAGSSTSYDPLDTNQDGYVSAEERLAGTSTSGTAQKSGVTSSRLGSDTLRFLMSGMNEVAA